MKTPIRLSLALSLLSLGASSHVSHAQRRMENLSRGVVAVKQENGQVFVSWRLLGTDAEGTAFNLYRAAGGAAVKINAQPLTSATSFVDTSARNDVANTYSVRALAGNREAAVGKTFTLAANAPAQQYLSIPLQTPAGYTPNDASVGDLDGDGDYEIILNQTARGADNSSRALTDPVILQAYKMDGTLMWSINLGRNIRAGAHYTQFMVADLDGDGRAEIACKTADGTVDGKGKVIGDANADFVSKEPGTLGKILSGPEFFTVFDGLTGAALATTEYLPGRGDIGGWGGIGGNGGNDSTGNRVDRFTAGVAYLDGVLPSVVMARGYYGRTVLAAWDFRGGKLSSRWVFDTSQGYPTFAGMGNHGLSVADVDADGRDEIVYGAMVVDDNGKGLFSTGLRHGDALHVGDLDPARPGLEVYGVHEIEAGTKGPGTALYDAKTGEVLVTGDPDRDVGRGVAADIDPRYPGAELWGGSEGLKTVKGVRIGEAPRAVNFLVWWDGDLLREILDSNRISKWDYQGGTLTPLLTATGASSNNGTKATPALSADLFGDWREEVMLRASDNQSLRIYTTTILTNYRFVTLMHDPQYRNAIAWQNVGYNQPPHPSFFLGEGMAKPPRANIAVVGAARN